MLAGGCTEGGRTDVNRSSLEGERSTYGEECGGWRIAVNLRRHLCRGGWWSVWHERSVRCDGRGCECACVCVCVGVGVCGCECGWYGDDIVVV